MIPPTHLIDGHHDALCVYFDPRHIGERTLEVRSTIGHFDLPRAREGRVGAAFYAIQVPSEKAAAPADADFLNPPPAAPVDQATAWQATMLGVEALHRLEAAGHLRVVRDVAGLDACLADGVPGAILHVEGAECIDTSLHALHALHAMGLRSLGPTWSRNNAFGDGVPFRFPSTPDIGGGLTEAGRRLVVECNRLGIILDVSHLNLRGFHDLLDLSTAPVVASHSNAHAICPSSRNLTDDQMRRLARSGGLAGLNFFVCFLSRDGARNPHIDLDIIGDHAAHMADVMGIDHLAIGSDFDGATMPEVMGGVAGMGMVVEVLERRGFTGEDLEKICWKNWRRVMAACWR